MSYVVLFKGGPMKKIIALISIAVLGVFLNIGLAVANAPKSNADPKPSADPKPIVLVVSSNSCPMCDEFESRVLSNPEVKKELGRFTLQKANAHTSKVRVEVTPTVIIYDKNHKQIMKFVPSLDKSKFIEKLKKVK